MPRTPDEFEALGRSPLLARAAMRLWDALEARARLAAGTGTPSEAFSDVELDLSHPSCPCLLIASPGRPDLYVELFLDGEGTEDDLNPEDEEPGDEEPGEEEDGPRLVALVNWVGSEDDPAIIEGDPVRPEALLAEVLGAVQAMLGAA